MKNEVKQEYIANNQNPLVLLTSENGKPKDLVGHLVTHSDQKVWAPYSVGDELDFGHFYSRYPKFVETGYGKYGNIDKALKSPEGLLFLIADGMFPMGCGVRKPNTVFAVQPKTTNPDDIAKQIEADCGYCVTDVHQKASGKLGLVDCEFHVYDFSQIWYDNQQAYLDAVAGLVNSNAVRGTPIIFHAKLK
jgi:hypothetical protein